MKCMSIITNFGCHYKCPYCIVKNNGLHVPKTTIEGLKRLSKCLQTYRCDTVSISGGGDPLYDYEKHVDWYRELFGKAAKNCRIEMHTSYMTDETTFPFHDCHRVVYHAHSIDQLSHIRKTGDEIVRVVFVVTSDYTLEDLFKIALFVHTSGDIDELGFRQYVDDQYKAHHYLEDYLRLGHETLWYYIEQGDDNLYYAENRVLYRYQDFKEATFENVESNQVQG